MDIIILGAGVAGLYSAYQYLLRAPGSRLLVLEKENFLGGRIYSYNDKYMDVEAGAGRFHTGQEHTIKLLKDIGLYDLSISIGNKGADYYDIHHVDDKDKSNPNNEIVLKLIELSKRESIDKLRDISLLDFCDKVLHESETKILKESFGYYSELVIMNAHDALELIKRHLSVDHNYMILKGGLSQIIERLETKIVEMGGVIKKNHIVTDIHELDGGEFQIDVLINNKQDGTIIGKKNPNKTNKNGLRYGMTKTQKSKHVSKNKNYYISKLIISALPKQVVQKIFYFKEIKKDLRKIVCESLCRIYSKFPANKSGKVWFDGISKFDTNNNLRMVIPINSENGIIMTSYTDYKYARFWKRLYDNKGVSVVNKELVRLLKQSTGIEDIPLPIVTHMFFWECGVGYWGVGVNSEEVATKMICPFGNNIFLCGEHFSEKNQQWIEGALETSENVISRIFL